VTLEPAPYRGGLGTGVRVAVMLLLALVVPGPGLAQPALQVAEARYRTALAAYEEILGSRDRALQDHEILLDRHDDARRSGDDDRAREAMSRVHFQGTYVMRLEQGLQAAVEPLRAAGRELLRALDAREEALLDELDRAILPGTRARLQEEIADLRLRYRDVERRTGAGLVPTARLLPDLGIGPRDGPQELRAKAGLMESWAEQYDAVLAALDREIATRERRIQQERGREDLLAGISRFGDDRLVGGGLVRSEPESVAAASEEGSLPNLASLPLPEQVAALREYRERIVETRAEALAQARLFRERADGGPR
jgi:hypothetical protein